MAPRRTMRPTIRTLREIRRSAGLTLPTLAAETGISRGTLSHLERGRMIANQRELDRLSAALGITLVNRPQVVAAEDVGR